MSIALLCLIIAIVCMVLSAIRIQSPIGLWELGWAFVILAFACQGYVTVR